MANDTPFNPLETKFIGRNIVEAFVARPVTQLPPPAFQGVGIYGIYYVGDHPLYGPIATRNRNGRFEMPIYVGKAVTPGTRRGILNVNSPATNALHVRLREHASSIRMAEDLQIEDFYCRYLLLEDVWIPAGEAWLINEFKPIWNSIIDGFGNHPPGRGREAQRRSEWDVLHPGRASATQVQSAPARREILLARIDEYWSRFQTDANENI
ncbi:MAG: Eco29kI family restriction endonuclease [Chloroflexia bacterium]